MITIILTVLSIVQITVFIILRLMNNKYNKNNNKYYSISLLAILMISNTPVILTLLILSNVFFLTGNAVETKKLIDNKIEQSNLINETKLEEKQTKEVEETQVEEKQNEEVVETTLEEKQTEVVEETKVEVQQTEEVEETKLEAQQTEEVEETQVEEKQTEEVEATQIDAQQTEEVEETTLEAQQTEEAEDETEEDLTDDEETDDEIVITRSNEETGKMIIIRYKKSFSAKLNLSDDINKEFYTTLKNKLLSYKSVKSRVSWNYDAFNLGRKQTSKINIRGKSIFVYLPLNPNDYEDTKYTFKDCSNIKKYEQLPFRVKVKSNRGLKYALELIEFAMDKLDASLLNETPNENYYEKNRGFNKLLEEGLIKEIIDEDTFKDLTEINKEFLDSNIIRSIDLETVKNLKFSEDTIKTIKKNVQGKKEIINIDTLSNNFNDGDVITVDVLKDKKLVSKNTTSVKCLARGVLDKKLTLDLQDYSSDAVKMIVITGGKVL